MAKLRRNHRNMFSMFSGSLVGPKLLLSSSLLRQAHKSLPWHGTLAAICSVAAGNFTPSLRVDCEGILYLSPPQPPNFKLRRRKMRLSPPFQPGRGSLGSSAGFGTRRSCRKASGVMIPNSFLFVFAGVFRTPQKKLPEEKKTAAFRTGLENHKK